MYYGIYTGIVAGAADPIGKGRVQVTVPMVGGVSAAWAATCVPPEGRSSYLPGQQVWVMFEGGDASKPVVMGKRP